MNASGETGDAFLAFLKRCYILFQHRGYSIGKQIWALEPRDLSSGTHPLGKLEHGFHV
jgi:hypothetical protein